MDNRRKLERKRTGAYVAVFDTRTNTSLGCLVDITTAGFRLLSTKPLSIDRLYSVRLEIPAPIAGSRMIALETKSVWCRKNQETNLFDVGFIIRALSEDNLHRLELWMEHPSFNKSGSTAAKPQG
jgi:hypothetical protein